MPGVGERIDGSPVLTVLPVDAIPSIDNPVYVWVAKADRSMRAEEPVLGVTDGKTAKVYSAWQLNHHEIVNDTAGKLPIAVTWRPLCSTGIVYARPVVEGTLLSFGVSEKLWKDVLVMYDRETGSLWSHVTREAVRGRLAGNCLAILPSTLSFWFAWKGFSPGNAPVGTVTERTVHSVCFPMSKSRMIG